jgi:hypothetical protein
MSYWRKLSNACQITLILMALWFVFLIAIGHYNDAVFVLGLTPFIVDRVSAPTRQGWGRRAGTCHDARGGRGRVMTNLKPGVLLWACGRSHFNEVTLESSVAPSDRAARLRPATAIATIPIAKSEPRTAFALSHLSNPCGFLR